MTTLGKDDVGQKLKVLYVLDSLETGGTERSIIEIAAHLGEVDAVICHIYRGCTLKGMAEAAGIRVVSLDLDGKYAPIAAIRGIRRVIREVRPDVLHTALVRGDLFGRMAGRLSGVPIVGSFVSETYGANRTVGMLRSTRAKLGAIRMVDRCTARWVTTFVAVSNRVATTEGRSLNVDSSRIEIIPRGREIPDMSKVERASARLEVRNELSVATDAQLAIVVGRLIPTKGHAELLTAFRTVCGDLPRLHLVIVGDGPRRHNIERQIADERLGDRVHLLGSRGDVPRLLAASDAFVFPTRYEGHPGALVEALLAGLPTMVSDIPVHREFLDDGVTTVFFPADDPKEMGKAMLHLLSDEVGARRIAETARTIAEERFDIRNIARRHVALYQHVVRAARQRD